MASQEGSDPPDPGSVDLSVTSTVRCHRATDTRDFAVDNTATETNHASEVGADKTVSKKHRAPPREHSEDSDADDDDGLKQAMRYESSPTLDCIVVNTSQPPMVSVIPEQSSSLFGGSLSPKTYFVWEQRRLYSWIMSYDSCSFLL